MFYQKEIVYHLLTIMGLSLNKLLTLFLEKPSMSPNWVHLQKFEKDKQTTGKA